MNLLNKLLVLIERIAAKLQGKGWGSGTVKKEFKSIVKLLTNNSPKLCIDIGGNIGTYSEQVVNTFSDCKIVIFEPAESNVKTLTKKFNKLISIAFIFLIIPQLLNILIPNFKSFKQYISSKNYSTLDVLKDEEKLHSAISEFKIPESRILTTTPNNPGIKKKYAEDDFILISE